MNPETWKLQRDTLDTSHANPTANGELYIISAVVRVPGI